MAQNMAENMAEKTNSLDRSLTLPAVKNFFSAWTSPTNKLLEPSRQARGYKLSSMHFEPF